MHECDIVNLLEVDEVSLSLPVLRSNVSEHQVGERRSQPQQYLRHQLV